MGPSGPVLPHVRRIKNQGVVEVKMLTVLVDQALQHGREALVVRGRAHRRHGAQRVEGVVVRVVDAPVFASVTPCMSCQEARRAFGSNILQLPCSMAQCNCGWSAKQERKDVLDCCQILPSKCACREAACVPDVRIHDHDVGKVLQVHEAPGQPLWQLQTAKQLQRANPAV